MQSTDQEVSKMSRTEKILMFVLVPYVTIQLVLIMALGL